MGGTLDNSNALKHGLSAGKLPKGASYVMRMTSRLSESLEAEALEVRGRLGVYELACINSAIRWERHALLCQRWLREAEDLTPDQKIAFSREIARASSERDKSLKALGLDAMPEVGPVAFQPAAAPSPDTGSNLPGG